MGKKKDKKRKKTKNPNTQKYMFRSGGLTGSWGDITRRTDTPLINSIMRGMPLSMSYQEEERESYVDRMIGLIQDQELPGRTITRFRWPDAPENEGVLIIAGSTKDPNGEECPANVVFALADGYQEKTVEIHVSPETAKQIVNRIGEAIATLESTENAK